MIILLLPIISIVAVRCQNIISPCPRLFQYEPFNRNEPDRWYGMLTLLSDSDQNGVWLKIILNKPALQLGNWFGQITSEGHKEFLISNNNHKLKAHVPYMIRIYIKYDTREPPPYLIGFRLNARTVCPEGGPTTTEPTSAAVSITDDTFETNFRLGGVTGQSVVSIEPVSSMPLDPGRSTTASTFIQPGSSFNITTDDNDYFQEDFSSLFRPKPPPVASPRCGIVLKSPLPLIANAKQDEEGEYPWHAVVYYSRGIDLTYACDGSLISIHHIITVAHCVTNLKSKRTLPPNSLAAYLGKFYLKGWSSPGIQDRRVETIFVHEKYDSTIYNHDIAIMKLKEPVEITMYVRPICLWTGPVSLDSLIGRLGTVVGWSVNENGINTGQLTKFNMPVVSQGTCIYSFPDAYSVFTSDKTYCAGFKSDTSVCNRDFGGGMVFPKRSNNSDSVIWYLRGMVSRSVSFQNQFNCDSSHFVVFTDIAKYLDWIKNILSQ